MSAADRLCLYGAEAERSVPPAMQGALVVLREKGHVVTVRRSLRTGSWYYVVDGRPEVRGAALCQRYRRYGL